jgi:hypothetical protein
MDAQYKIIEDQVHEIHNIVVHRFRMGDVEDPDLYAAQPLWEWQESEQGRWIMERAIEAPIWHRQVDAMSYGHEYAITAKLKERDYTHWLVKWKKLST